MWNNNYLYYNDTNDVKYEKKEKRIENKACKILK